MKEKWFWIFVGAVTLLAVSVVFYAAPGTSIQPLLILWFLCACPGLTIMRFYRLKTPLLTGLLALAISLVVDSLIAGVQIYTGIWSPPGTLLILLLLCLTGVGLRSGISYIFQQRAGLTHTT